MNISTIKKLTDGTSINAIVLVSGKRTSYKSDGKPYLNIMIQDASGSMEFPIWDDYEKNNDIINIKDVVCINGKKSSFNTIPQIKLSRLTHADANEVDYSLLIPTYDIPEELNDYFISTVEKLDEKYRTIIEAAFNDEETWDCFISCPAAEKHHGNKRGGLFLHTVGVMKCIDYIINNYVDTPFFTNASNVINKDRLMLCAILHDIMKIKEYEYDISIRRKNILMDHLTLGAAYVQELNEECNHILEDEEIDIIQHIILTHHGEYGYYKPKTLTLEEKLLHLADMIDSQIVGASEMN